MTADAVNRFKIKPIFHLVCFIMEQPVLKTPYFIDVFHGTGIALYKVKALFEL